MRTPSRLYRRLPDRERFRCPEERATRGRLRLALLEQAYPNPFIGHGIVRSPGKE